jgi:hypothetical protein
VKQIIGIYIRLDENEIQRLRDRPEVLPKYDPRVALDDGRGLDLGRAWEELGVFLDGGIKLPDDGPTVGDTALPSSDSRATWSYVTPDRVVELAALLRQMRRKQFRQRYESDGEDTLTLPGTTTGEWGDRAQYMYSKLRQLAQHYATAAENGEAMLVRIGERL